MELWKSESEKFKKVESTNSKAGKLAVRWRNTDTKQFWMSCTVPNQVKVYNSLAMHLVALEGKNSDETLKHNSDFSVWGTPNARQEKQIKDSAQSSFLVCIQEVPEQCKSHWEQTPGSATSTVVCGAPFLEGRWEGNAWLVMGEAFLKCFSFNAMLRVSNSTFLQSQSFVGSVSGVLKHPPTVFSPSCLQQIQDLEQERNLLAFAGLETIQQQSSATWADSRGMKPTQARRVWSRESSGALQYQRYPPEWTTRNIPAVGFCLNSLQHWHKNKN